MSNEVKQDFETATVKHLLFKSKLRSFLHGSDTAEAPIRDPEVCLLGQWIRNHGIPVYGQLRETQELDRQHRLIHQVANRLMDLKLAGRPEDALAGFAEIEQLSEKIVGLLQTMQQKLRNGA